MLLTKKVTVNLGYRDAGTVLDGVQGDSGRALQIGLMVGETAWRIPGDAQVLLQYACEDGTGGIYDTLPDGTPASEIGEDDSLTVTQQVNIQRFNIAHRIQKRFAFGQTAGTGSNVDNIGT